MHIFILEDNEKRMIKFRRELIGHKIDHAKTLQDGTSLVVTQKYDLLFLDHDLGGREMVDSSDGNTGYQLAEFIASFTPNKTTPCVIHSCNPCGAENMSRILSHSLLIPFHLLCIESVLKWVELCQ